jgi:hypothetical protein
MSAQTLIASGNHGSGRIGSALDCVTFNTLRLLLDVTVDTIPAGQSANNSPVLEVHVETSPTSADGANWRRVASFAPVQAVGQQTKTLVGFDRYVRVAWIARCFVVAIDGIDQQPAFTWALTAEAT